MKNDLEQLLPFVSKASRYLGNEINAVRKNPAAVDLTFALAFPDAYEVGMSHLGLQILYHVLNSTAWIACERAFAPWPDMEAEMQAAGVPLATLESGIPLRQCDIVGFSLEYELSYATVLRMLSLAGIPLQASQRGKKMPLVIAGGPSTYNPEPVADFFDAFVIGEGEEVLPELCMAYMRWKQSGADKNSLLRMLAGIPGIYVPSFFHVAYNDDGSLQKITPRKGQHSPVVKRVVTGFSQAPWCSSPVVPYMQVIHDRAGIEIARGCTRGCRFCMAGMIYRPVREKSAGHILELCRSTLAGTGYEELGLLSLSSGDYCGMQPLLSSLIAEHGHRKVAVSLPSLRVETLTSDLMEQISQVRKTGFTIAPEAGTQRLRNVINKGFTDEEILATVRRIFDAGWHLVKLYFMIGLPTETMQDVEGIVALCRRIARLDRGKSVNVSISTFVPKPHTPFQWEALEQAGAVLEKQRFIKESLRGGNMQVKYHDYRLSLLEAVFSRGNRRLADALAQAHRLGAGYEAWTEHFDSAIWDEAFRSAGINTDVYIRARSLDALLPWHHISCGVDTAYLHAEREKALLGEITADCREGVCTGCGVCIGTSVCPEVNQDAPVPEEPDMPAAAPAAYRYRLALTKQGTARFMSHLEFSSSLARAMRRAGLPLRHSQGFHPLPRLTFQEALPVGMESERELCDVELTERLAPEQILELLEPQLPEGVRILQVIENVLKSGGTPDTIKIYSITFPADEKLHFPDADSMGRAIADFRKRDGLVIQFQKKDRSHEADLKKVIRSIDLADDGSLAMTIDAAAGSMPRIADMLGMIFKLGSRERQSLRIMKRIV